MKMAASNVSIIERRKMTTNRRAYIIILRISERRESNPQEAGFEAAVSASCTTLRHYSHLFFVAEDLLVQLRATTRFACSGICVTAPHVTVSRFHRAPMYVHGLHHDGTFGYEAPLFPLMPTNATLKFHRWPPPRTGRSSSHSSHGARPSRGMYVDSRLRTGAGCSCSARYLFSARSLHSLFLYTLSFFHSFPD